MSERSAVRTHASVVAGDLRGVADFLRGAQNDAWGLAIRGAAHLIDGSVPLPEPAEASALGSRDAQAIDAACGWAELAAFARFDRPALEAWLALHEKAAGPRLALGRALSDLLRGRAEGLDRVAAEIESTAAKQHDAALTVDAASVRALALLAIGEHGDAIAHARRASRMARTEGLPIQEFLAHLGLARVRRWQGRPSLATRILSALARAAPRAWWGWIALEQLLAGGIDPAAPILAELESGPPTAAVSAARSLARVLRAAASGDREAFERAGAELSGAGSVEVARELDVLRQLIDPESAPDALPAPLASWCRGEMQAVAPGYPGLCMPGAEDSAGEQSAAAWAIADPGGRARRIPRAALALVESGAQVAQSRRKTGREDTALAVLALARGSLEVPDLFREVYGFAYVAELHEGVLRVLLHRLKQRLEDSGRIVWSAGSVALELDRRIAVPDPRCSRTADERVLLALAARGRATARDVAGALGMPLRTVQEAIRALVDEGACRARQDGRRVEYAVEDTTFSEPTHH